MAQVVQILLTDDLTGDTADETVMFAVDGQAYEIDLSVKNAEDLRSTLRKYADVARQTDAPTRGSRSRASSASRRAKPAVDTLAARAWLKANGHPDLKDRGRIPATLVDEYQNRDYIPVASESPAEMPATTENDIKEA